MKTRIIVGVVCVPLLAVVVLLLPLWVLGLLMGALCAIAAWEFFRCVRPDAPVRMPAVCGAMAALIPTSESLSPGGVWSYALFFCVMVYMFAELMVSFRGGKPLSFDLVAAGVLAGFAIPYFLTGIVRLGTMGRAFVVLPFLIAFASDTGAYFAGVYLGRHKLAPVLSPHKTIEGSAGGFLATIAVLLIAGLVFRALGYTVRFQVLAAYGLLGSLACQFGDLSFSAIKRLSGIKDYGKIIPGHGGILDRFDGMVFVAALSELLVTLVPAYFR